MYSMSYKPQLVRQYMEELRGQPAEMGNQIRPPVTKAGVKMCEHHLSGFGKHQVSISSFSRELVDLKIP